MKSILLSAFILLISLNAMTQDIRLFHIERNKNENIVCYDLKIENGKIKTSDPINIYWDLGKKSDKKPGLSGMERRMAYGISVTSLSENEVVFTMKAYNERPITVSYNPKEKTAVPVITIQGEKAILRKLYISATPPLYTSVVYIELYGKSLSSGKDLYEKIENK